MNKLIALYGSWVVAFGSGCATIPSGYNPNLQRNPKAQRSLAQCLIDKGVQLYVQTGCEHCDTQKQKLGTAWKVLEPHTFDCIYDYDECKRAGIRYIPTWDLPSGRETEILELEELADKVDCDVE